MKWTFQPPCRYYNHEDKSAPKRVLLIGVEPNGDVDGPHNNDMGAWMWNAHAHRFWNPGGRRFFRAQLLHMYIARVALGGMQADDHNREWYEAGDNKGEALAQQMMKRCRIVDIKSTAGGSSANYREVESWVKSNLEEVKSLFEPMPDIVIAQGSIVRRLLSRYREMIIPKAVQNHALWFGLPHPSDQAAYPIVACIEAQNKVTSIEKGTLNYFSRGTWSCVGQEKDKSKSSETQKKLPLNGHKLFHQSLNILDQAILESSLDLVAKEPAGDWISFKSSSSGPCYVYLNYNDEIWLNRALDAQIKSLPYLQSHDYSYAGENTTRKKYTRQKYKPNYDDPSAKDRWKQLFTHMVQQGGIIP